MGVSKGDMLNHMHPERKPLTDVLSMEEVLAIHDFLNMIHSRGMLSPQNASAKLWQKWRPRLDKTQCNRIVSAWQNEARKTTEAKRVIRAPQTSREKQLASGKPSVSQQIGAWAILGALLMGSGSTNTDNTQKPNTGFGSLSPKASSQQYHEPERELNPLAVQLQQQLDSGKPFTDRQMTALQIAQDMGYDYGDAVKRQYRNQLVSKQELSR
jgi:hypothetical protein